MAGSLTWASRPLPAMELTDPCPPYSASLVPYRFQCTRNFWTYADEDLIRYGLPSDLWFHIDKLSSAHIYLRLPPSCPWGGWDEGLPDRVQEEMGQLVKANSIEGQLVSDPSQLTAETVWKRY